MEQSTEAVSKSVKKERREAKIQAQGEARQAKRNVGEALVSNVGGLMQVRC